MAGSDVAGSDVAGSDVAILTAVIARSASDVAIQEVRQPWIATLCSQ